MEALNKQVRRARRRLVLQQFIAALSWCLFGTLLVAVFGIAAGKLWPPAGIDQQLWAAWWLGGALAAALLIAVVWTWVRARDSVEAAIELDRRFGLRERVSSTISLAPEELDSPIGRALVSDALRRVQHLDVADQFNVRPGRRALLPLVPALLAFAVAFFIDERGQQNPAPASPTPAKAAEVKRSAESLQKKLAQQRKEAAEKGLKDFAGELKKIEEGTKQLAKRDTADRKKALVDLNELAKKLEQRREKLGGNERIKEQLSQLKNLERGPADRMAEALKKGDFNQALQEMQKLKEQLAKGELDEEKKQQLIKQLEALEQKLKEMAARQEQAKADLQEQIKKLRESGQLEQAAKLQQQLDKLMQQNQNMDKLQQLANKLGQCAQCLKQGQGGQAAQALEGLAAQLGELAQQSDELAMLDQSLNDIMAAKGAMNCAKCSGAGCKACQGGLGMGKDGLGGDGLGQGQAGRGDRPEEKTNTNTYDSQVRQNPGRGKQIFAGEAEGPNQKGQVLEGIQFEFESAASQSTDPLTKQRLPRDRREHAQQYFDMFREGR